MMARLKFWLAAAALLALPAAAAPADDAQELSAHLGKAVGAFQAARLYGEQCDRRDPEDAQSRKDALAAWRYKNSGADYDRVIGAFTRAIPDLAGQIDQQTAQLAERVAKDLDASPEPCGDLGKLLAHEQFSVQSDVRRLLSLSRRLGIELPQPGETVRAKAADETRILRLAALSARLEARMAEIGSKEGAMNSSALRGARQDHAEAWLKSDGVLVLFGRVTGDSELREWRDDMQSSFKVDCHSFSERAHEERMAGAIGEDSVVVGTPRLVVDSAGGGRVSLAKCSLFTVEETARPFVEEDDAAGLVLRPLAFDEALAGPGQGIPIRDVDRVLYASSFDTRMDGFGNGYVDREEDIYVLLRDGTAYRHEWPFPFTDLAVALSRHREPERWFTWNERRGQVTLTGKGNARQDALIDLAKAQRLRPLASRPLAGEYHYLQIAAGGSRQDRRYAFSRDGTVVYSHGGFMAGNVGTGYLIVNGRDNPDTTSGYRIEDYALILDTPQGEERHFLAVPESAKGSPPDTLLIDGAAFWLDDD
ncbi:hypothetical protein FOZ76_01825 [Verticiella sediminum]|uniref:Uncharacterized protein n=1 Tax=Verticiella sediminum TaxID=1247510 RepID=A0A556B027_9BURK|nr:hypothetical protein [Verticiella sediminum]TSH98516.1 hypothetical protein FOZ76_01825 [Verticiella sediminum]